MRAILGMSNSCKSWKPENSPESVDLSRIYTRVLRLAKEGTYGNWFPLRFDQRPVLAVHLVVEPAGIAQVVSGGVPPPQGR